jgi:hypothetical protein
MENHKLPSRRAALEIWRWRQVHGFVSDRSVENLQKIIEHHTATAVVRRLAREILNAGSLPGRSSWRRIRDLALEISGVLDGDPTRKYEAPF